MRAKVKPNAWRRRSVVPNTVMPAKKRQVACHMPCELRRAFALFRWSVALAAAPLSFAPLPAGQWISAQVAVGSHALWPSHPLVPQGRETSV